MNGLPAVDAKLAIVLLRVRYGIDVARFDWPARSRDLKVPVLIIHSDSDAYISDAPAKELAAERPDLVTLGSFRGRDTPRVERGPRRLRTPPDSVARGEQGRGDAVNRSGARHAS